MILWTTWARCPAILFFCVLNAIPALGQDIDHYIDLAYQGQTDEARAAIPTLRANQAEEGALAFLEGLVEINGEKALKHFRRSVRVNPSGPYADDAHLKIGEYLYAVGGSFYKEAANELKNIPIHHPRSPLVYQSIRLLLNALLVSDMADTALFYTQVFAKKYPEMEFDLKAGRAPSTPDNAALTAGQTPKLTRDGEPTLEPIPAEKIEPGSTEARGRYQLQLGVFSVQSNAQRQKELLESLNYKVVLTQITSGGRILHRVRVGGFANESAARTTGSWLKDNYGMDYTIIRPR